MEKELTRCWALGAMVRARWRGRPTLRRAVGAMAGRAKDAMTLRR